MTQLEQRFLERVPNELHKLNELLTDLIDLLVSKQIDEYMHRDDEEV